MGYIKDQILKLTKQLYPTGRAFRIPFQGALDKLHNALSLSEERAWNDAVAIKYSILPDNANFTADDATDWERRLGMIYSPAVPLADRKAAILRKMNHPGTIPARQHYLYLEYALQLAAFNVYVYENRFALYPSGYETHNPLTVSSGVGAYVTRHGPWRHGQRRHGISYNPFNRVINHIDEALDAPFDVGSNLRSTFFIGGPTIGSFANVDINRKDEFRQLILRIKPAQTVAYLFINYV